VERKVKIKLDKIVKDFVTEEGVKNHVLDSIDADIDDQEFVVIVGPSGCGKTTLLSIVAGFEPPTSGQVFLDDKVVERPGPERGVVFQETSVFPWRKVIHMVEYGLVIKGYDKKQRREIAIKYLSMMGLQDKANSYPKELSGGMLKRLAVATVFANDPEVLLMDEPFSALDYPTKCNLQNELLNIWSKEKKTTLFVTHDVEEAVFLADRVFVLDEGRFVNVYQNPFPRPRLEKLRDDYSFLEAKAYLKSCYGSSDD
jgi:NitT/TauT family transport system ATP-binding protein